MLLMVDGERSNSLARVEPFSRAANLRRISITVFLLSFGLRPPVLVSIAADEILSYGFKVKHHFELFL